MTFTYFLALFPMLLGISLIESAGPEPQAGVRRLVVNQEVILRVPVQPRPPVPRLVWEARDGPKCLPTKAIRGALSSGSDHVDFVLERGRRVRARFEKECAAIDFYNGFYLKPESDKLCARRDFVHSRIGGSCRIETFHQLVPKLRH